MADQQYLVWAGTHEKEISEREAFTPMLENTPAMLADLLVLLVERKFITPKEALELARSPAEVY